MRKFLKTASAIIFAGAVAFTTILGAGPVNTVLNAEAASMYTVTPNWTWVPDNPNDPKEYTAKITNSAENPQVEVFLGSFGDTIQVKLPNAPQGKAYCREKDSAGNLLSTTLTSNGSQFVSAQITDIDSSRYLVFTLREGATPSTGVTFTYKAEYICDGRCGSTNHNNSRIYIPTTATIKVSYSGITTNNITELNFQQNASATQTLPFYVTSTSTIYNVNARWCTLTGSNTSSTPAGTSLKVENGVISVSVSPSTPAGVYYFIIEAQNGIHSDVIKVNVGTQKYTDIRDTAILAPFTQGLQKITLPSLPEGASYNDLRSINVSQTTGVKLIQNFTGITQDSPGVYVLNVDTIPVAANTASDVITINLSNGVYEPFNVIITVSTQKIDLTKKLIQDIFFASRDFGISGSHIRYLDNTYASENSVYAPRYAGLINLDAFGNDTNAANRIKSIVAANPPSYSFSGQSSYGTSYTSSLIDAITNAAPTNTEPYTYSISWINGATVFESFAKSSIEGLSGTSATYGDKYTLPTSFVSQLKVYQTRGLYKHQDIPTTQMNQTVYTSSTDRSASFNYKAYTTNELDRNVSVTWYIDNMAVSATNNNFVLSDKGLSLQILDAGLLGAGAHKINCSVSCNDNSGITGYSNSSVATLTVVNGASGTTSSIPISGNNNVKVNATLSGENILIDEVTPVMLNTVAQDSKVKSISFDLSTIGKNATSITFTSQSISNMVSILSGQSNNIDALEIRMPKYNMYLDHLAIAAALNQSSNNNITFGCYSKMQTGLTQGQQTMLKAMSLIDLYDVFIQAGNTRVTNLNNGKLAVDFKDIKVASDKNRDYYHVYYVPETGTVERQKTTFKDTTVSTVLSHLSDYAVIYDSSTRNDNEESATVVYRLFKNTTGEHLYTTDANEVKTLTTEYGWKLETSPGNSADETGVPIYRLFNAQTGEHLYTPDVNECNVLTASYGWTFDNGKKPLFYGSKTATTKGVYRLFKASNPAVASHHYTSDINEIKELVTNYKFTYDNKGKPLYYLL